MDSWVALDFETANGSRASACSVALVRVEGGVVADSFSTFIRPPAEHGYFAPRNTQIHGIRSADVVHAPRWPQVWKEMHDFIAGAPVVAHNAAFDLSVIRAANDATGIPWPVLRYACTVVLAKRTWQDLPNYRLPRVALAAGIDFSDHHRAEADALAAAQILLAQQRAHGVDTIDRLLGAAGVQWGRLHPGGYTTCRS
ncbi:3'-5' exonuclease [Glycomyces buryatensis]|uniref:DNA polymerase III subunit epsilon n=1 Tax=Glycomyces buryatensis TaxID=2570927 RepID=A0A4S8QEJ0_9ACTN|nr:3'-5' exonuclease [Glycomyces buryatensis]THV43013.1 DNA polymerase III subunit epsilon [Glycomyces buryatensis]